MGEFVNDLASSFAIRELTGDQRTLTLKERALPYRPFELRGKQRNSVDWYNGSPVGTLQVYGASENPTTINGMWKDKFLGGVPGSAAAEVTSAVSEVIDGLEAIGVSSQVLFTARDLAQLVDDMRRKGQEIEVTWLNQVRRGLIDEFVQRWQNGHDLEWELTFAWVSQGEDLDTIAAKPDASDLGDLPNKAQALIDEIVDDKADLVPQAGDRFADVNSALTAVGGSIQDLADELTDMVVQAASTVSQPGESLRRAVGILDGIKLEAELIRDIAQDTADGIALDLTEFQAFGVSLAERANMRGRITAADNLRDLAAREEVRLVTSIASTVIRVFQAREGQDLRQVSQVYFGTPDEWPALMVFNRLSSSRLSAGQVVFVPARPVGAEC